MRCRSSDQKMKQRHRKGLWSPEEDQKLKNYVLNHGHGCWTTVPIKAGLQRNGKSCRLRWINYLRPGLKRGMFSKEEEDTILSLHCNLGNKWSRIAQHLPGRTDNEIKNYWHTYLKKKSRQTDQVSTSQTTSSTDLTDHQASPTSKLKITTPSCDLRTDANVKTHPPSHPFIPFDQTCFPRLFFTEWLPPEDRPFHFSNLQDLTVQTYSFNPPGYGGEFINNYGKIENDNSHYDISEIPEFKPGNQPLGMEDDICNDLMMVNDDFMYGMMEECFQASGIHQQN